MPRTVCKSIDDDATFKNADSSGKQGGAAGGLACRGR